MKGPPSESPIQTIRIGLVEAQTQLVDCEINGTSIKAIMNCGGPICILSGSVFRKMGLNVGLVDVQSRTVGAEG